MHYTIGAPTCRSTVVTPMVTLIFPAIAMSPAPLILGSPFTDAAAPARSSYLACRFEGRMIAGIACVWPRNPSR